MTKIEFPIESPVERFHGFQDLIQKRVQDVLLVSTLYDYYILSQDGRLNEQFLGSSSSSICATHRTSRTSSPDKRR